MDELDITQAIKDIIESENTEDAQKFINDLYRVYQRFNQTSNRVLRVLRQFMPNNRAKTGLAECILGFIETSECVTYNEICNYVHREFEYTVTNKSISDSIYRLKKVEQITSFYDRKRKCKVYKKSKYAVDNNSTTIY